MKRCILFIAIICMIPGQIFCQDTAFLTVKDFQVEKARLQGLIYQAKRTNQALQDKLQTQAASLDSMVRILEVQAEEMVNHQDSLNQLHIYQSDLDSRLITQKRSGTLLAILIPAGLFVLFLILLIWLIAVRQRAHSMFNTLDARIDALSKRLDDQLNTSMTQHEAIKAQIKASEKDSTHRIQELSGEIDEKIQKIEKLMQEENAAHDSMHKESHTEFEKIKGELKKGYDSTTEELVNVKEGLTKFVNDLTAQIKELANKGEE